VFEFTPSGVVQEIHDAIFVFQCFNCHVSLDWKLCFTFVEIANQGCGSSPSQGLRLHVGMSACVCM
jgi:hypothetical protein